MKKQGGYFDFDLGAFILVILVMGVFLGITLTLGLPILWEWIKPFIHAISA